MKKQQHKHVLLCVMLLLVSVLSAQTKTDHSIKSTSMTNTLPQQKNKDIVRSFYEDALNKRNYTLLNDIVSEQYTGIRGLKGAVAITESVLPLIAAFPDIQYHLEELIGEGDKVTLRWKWQGTHQKAYQQFAATGKQVVNEGMAIYELKDNKIIGIRMQIDRLGFLQELGALPLDLTSLSGTRINKDQVQFIDKFVVPSGAKEEFLNRVKINRGFIKTLAGFVEDAAYESTDEKGFYLLITVATWQSKEALMEAKEAVQAEYRKEGFNPAQFMERLHITMDRGFYKKVLYQP